MKKPILAIVILCSLALCAFQYVPTAFNKGGVSITGDISWYQDATSSITANSGSFGIQGGCGASGSGSCSWKVLPTQAGSVRFIGIITTAGTAVHITPVYDCTSSNPCLSSSGDKLDTCVISGSQAWEHDGANTSATPGGATGPY